MTFLIVTPPQVITENQTQAASIQKENAGYVKKQLADLGISDGPIQTIVTGGFRGTQIFKWAKPYVGILQTTFLTPTGKTQTQLFLRMSTLVRRDDCLQLGATWDFTQNVPTKKPASVTPAQVSLAQISERTPRDLSPVKLETRGTGDAVSRVQVLFEGVVIESLAAQGQPIVSATNQLACKWTTVDVKLPPIKKEYPARAHRLLISQLQANQPTEGSWPMLNKAVIHYHSGIFGDKSVLVAEVSKPVLFDPNQFVGAIRDVTGSVTHNIKEESFTVIKRKGRWVYLDRGRAYGLEIGMHLQGRDESKLHVIQFTGTEEKNPDVAVAYIRQENKATPLKAGDTITFDLTKFPKTQP